MQASLINETEAGQASYADGKGKRDWQITSILPNDMLVETDCNSGVTRKLRKSRCSCGQAVLIEYDARTCRADGKRIFYPDIEDAGWCAFRCKQCHQPVNESVPGAEFGQPLNAKTVSACN